MVTLNHPQAKLRTYTHRIPRAADSEMAAALENRGVTFVTRQPLSFATAISPS